MNALHLRNDPDLELETETNHDNTTRVENTYLTRRNLVRQGKILDKSGDKWPRNLASTPE